MHRADHARCSTGKQQPDLELRDERTSGGSERLPGARRRDRSSAEAQATAAPPGMALEHCPRPPGRFIGVFQAPGVGGRERSSGVAPRSTISALKVGWFESCRKLRLAVDWCPSPAGSNKRSRTQLPCRWSWPGWWLPGQNDLSSQQSRCFGLGHRRTGVASVAARREAPSRPSTAPVYGAGRVRWRRLGPSARTGGNRHRSD